MLYLFSALSSGVGTSQISIIIIIIKLSLRQTYPTHIPTVPFCVSCSLVFVIVVEPFCVRSVSPTDRPVERSAAQGGVSLPMTLMGTCLVMALTLLTAVMDMM